MTTFGKGVMLLLWIVLLSAPLAPWSDYWLWFWFGGALLALIHSVQMLSVRLALQESELWLPGDTWKLIIFGVFALLVIYKRKPKTDQCCSD